MKPTTAYQQGWKTLFGYKKMWLLLYLLNFFFALIGTIPLSGFLNQTLAHSLENQQLLNGFDYTFFQDFLSEYGLGLSAIFDQSLLLIFLFFIFSIFLTGGILHILKTQEPFKYTNFLQGCAYYFWRLLRLTFYFLLIQAALLGLSAMLFTTITGGISPFELESDSQVLHAIQIVIPLYLIIAIIFIMIKDYAKIHIAYQDKSLITQPIWQTFKMVFRNFPKFILLYLLNIITFLIIFGIYWLINESLAAKTGGAIFIVLLVGQAFVFARIGVRILNLASANILYHSVHKVQ